MFRSPRIIFDNRVHAGRLLGEKLKELGYMSTPEAPVVALALPRGGLPVAEQVCNILGCPLDIVVSKKIGFPGHEEFAIGAVSARGAVLLNSEVMDRYRGVITDKYIQDQAKRISEVCHNRERQMRGNAPMIDVRDKIVLLVDDGIATGMSMKAAIHDIKALNPRKLVVAVPVLAYDTLVEMRRMKEIDDIVYLDAPEDFRAVGRFYKDFSETTDEEALQIIEKFRRRSLA